MSFIQRARVVIVDDDIDGADSLALVLAGAGHDVRTAYSGIAGIAIMSAFLPDLVFCRVGMHGVDGFDLARIARKIDAGYQPVLIAMSGWTDAARSRLIAKCFDVHLVKPISFDVIWSIMGDGLE